MPSVVEVEEAVAFCTSFCVQTNVSLKTSESKFLFPTDHPPHSHHLTPPGPSSLREKPDIEEHPVNPFPDACTPPSSQVLAEAWSQVGNSQSAPFSFLLTIKLVGWMVSFPPSTFAVGGRGRMGKAGKSACAPPFRCNRRKRRCEVHHLFENRPQRAGCPQNQGPCCWGLGTSRTEPRPSGWRSSTCGPSHSPRSCRPAARRCLCSPQLQCVQQPG